MTGSTPRYIMGYVGKFTTITGTNFVQIPGGNFCYNQAVTINCSIKSLIKMFYKFSF